MIRKIASSLLLMAGLASPLASQVKCTLSSFGKGCGPTLTGSVSPNKGPGNRVFTHLLNLKTTGAPATTLGIVMAGTRKVTWKLPFMACDMLINFRGAAVLPSNKSGAASGTLRFRAVAGLTVHFQHIFFEFGKGGVKAVNSNGLTLSCTKA